jgi:hypothetical protein
MVRSLAEAEAQLWEQLSQLNKNAQFSIIKISIHFKLYNADDSVSVHYQLSARRYDSALLDIGSQIALSIQHQIDVIIIEEN